MSNHHSTATSVISEHEFHPTRRFTSFSHISSSLKPLAARALSRNWRRPFREKLRNTTAPKMTIHPTPPPTSLNANSSAVQTSRRPYMPSASKRVIKENIPNISSHSLQQRKTPYSKPIANFVPSNLQASPPSSPSRMDTSHSNTTTTTVTLTPITELGNFTKQGHNSQLTASNGVPSNTSLPPPLSLSVRQNLLTSKHDIDQINSQVSRRTINRGILNPQDHTKPRSTLPMAQSMPQLTRPSSSIRNFDNPQTLSGHSNSVLSTQKIFHSQSDSFWAGLLTAQQDFLLTHTMNECIQDDSTHPPTHTNPLHSGVMGDELLSQTIFASLQERCATKQAYASLRNFQAYYALKRKLSNIAWYTATESVPYFLATSPRKCNGLERERSIKLMSMRSDVLSVESNSDCSSSATLTSHRRSSLRKSSYSLMDKLLEKINSAESGGNATVI